MHDDERKRKHGARREREREEIIREGPIKKLMTTVKVKAKSTKKMRA